MKQKLLLYLVFSSLLILVLTGCAAVAEPTHTEYILTTTMRDGNFVFLGVDGEINGKVNPALHAEPGETIKVMLVNSGEGKHNIVFDLGDSKQVSTDTITQQGETTTLEFTVPNMDAAIEYFDGEYDKLGMRGVLLVGNAIAETEEVASAEPVSGNSLASVAFQKGGCAACHVIPGVAGAIGTVGPDLSSIGQIVADRISTGEYTGSAADVSAYLMESIVSPDAFLSPQCPTGPCVKGVMPASLADTLSDEEKAAAVEYLSLLPDLAAAQDAAAAKLSTEPVEAAGVTLSDADFEWAKETFFQRCAGCHGTLRKGATGPALTPDVTTPKGTAGLAAIIFNGTTAGMPDWGKQGILTQEQTDIMAKFLQNEPPAPPEMSLGQMQESWELITPVEDRPTSPQTTRNIDNYFIVTLRDAGQVAIIDGDNYEIVSTVDSGYAVHITRMSASGRYAYVTGRDGRLALIDLWMEKPEVVARVQTCYDARSVEVSKYEGPEGDFRDKYAIAGCYWPPHFAIMDGQTLEPLKVVSSRSYTFDSGDYHPEPRVASILASHYAPEWVVNIKETGQIWIVNYLDPINPTIKMINASLFLHDGGLDSTHRYFLVAANQSNQIAVVDLKTGTLAGIADVGQVPHPGRGANWEDPEFGPVWSTPHLGEASIMSVATDPEGRPDIAWTSVRTTPLPGSGSLFIKTHPKSQWIWVDMTLNSDPAISRTVCVIAKSDPSKVAKCWEIGTYGRAVHFEYNKDGTEVWVSLWGNAATPGETGAIVIYDDATLEEKARISDMITPTGKFNVYNTMNDIY